MEKTEVLSGEILDEITLSIEELASACCVEQQWIVERVEAGILTVKAKSQKNWSFVSEDLARARRLASIERDFDANAELAALVTDLIEEISQLKQQLKIAGLQIRK